MIPKEKLPDICYCPCCCLSDDPADSEEVDSYNRCYECICKWRWDPEAH